MKLPFFLGLLLLSLQSLSQTERYQVYVIKFAALAHPSPISDWVDNGPKNDSVDVAFMFWLIRGNNGKNILLDAGFLHGSDYEKEFEFKSYQRPDSTLRKLDLKAGDITDIIISHPHWDHINGISLFPNAHIWIQKEDYNYFVSAAWLKRGAISGFDKRDVRAIVDLNLAGRVTLVEGDNKEIIPGIKVFTGSKHTFDSQFVLVGTGANRIVLASDNIWVYYNLEHLRPAAIGGTWDTTAYVNSMRRMKTLASDPRYIIPGHDEKVFSLFPQVAEGVVKIE